MKRFIKFIFLIFVFNCEFSNKKTVSYNERYEANHTVYRGINEYIIFLNDSIYIHSIPEQKISDTSHWQYVGKNEVSLDNYKEYYDPSNGYMYFNYPEYIQTRNIQFVIKNKELVLGDFYYSFK